jgi:hypothetical protein
MMGQGVRIQLHAHRRQRRAAQLHFPHPVDLRDLLREDRCR